MNTKLLLLIYLGFMKKDHEPDPSVFLNYLQDNKLRRIVADIEMMSINEELSEQELTDYIKQVLNYPKLLKIKEKEAEGKRS